MPVSERTVPQSIKESQDKPGSGSQQQADKIQTPGFLPDPAEKVEEYKAGMEYRKEDIKKFHPFYFVNREPLK